MKPQTYLQQAVTIRERINAPSEMADTLHNLAEVSVKTGAFETALGQYLKALEVRRQVGDKRAAAIELYNLGTLFEYQGRYGAAVQSKAEAVKIFRELDDRGVWLPKVLAAYGSALAQAGRFEEARRLLGEALPIARDIEERRAHRADRHQSGRRLLLPGRLRECAPRVPGGRRAHHPSETPAGEDCLTAEPREDRDEGRKVAFTCRNAPAAGRHAERQGLKFEAAEYSLLAGESELRSKRYAQARAQLDSTLARADQLGARTLLAQAHRLLAVTCAANGEQAEARRHLTTARQLLEAIRKDAREKDAAGGPHPAALGLEADSPGYCSLSGPAAPTRSRVDTRYFTSTSWQTSPAGGGVNCSSAVSAAPAITQRR